MEFKHNYFSMSSMVTDYRGYHITLLPYINLKGSTKNIPTKIIWSNCEPSWSLAHATNCQCTACTV